MLHDDSEIQQAVSRNDLTRVIELLDSNPSLLLRISESGQSLLHDVAWNVNGSALAELLLHKGADVNARDSDGWSPLHRAAWEGNVNVASILLQHGAEADCQNESGWTPLRCAALPIGRRPEVIKLLLEHGAKLDLFSAMLMGRFDYIRDQLVHNKVALTELHFRNDLLREAIFVRSPELVELFLEHGADSNGLHSSLRVPPLCFACEDPRVPLSIIQLLLAHGADPNAACTQRQSVLDVAVRLSQGPTPRKIPSEVIDLLRSYGSRR